ncbi:hypothetical protein OG21DRAFT_1261554 [Imleria badia]|nr:hypothetical protein OG21DRAFT_1261554 [Imleria badia]
MWAHIKWNVRPLRFDSFNTAAHYPIDDRWLCAPVMSVGMFQRHSIDTHWTNGHAVWQNCNVVPAAVSSIKKVHAKQATLGNVSMPQCTINVWDRPIPSLTTPQNKFPSRYQSALLTSGIVSERTSIKTMSSALQSALTSLQQSNYTTLAVLTAVGYDYVLTFPNEIEYIWSKRWTWVSTLFVLVRYLGLLNLM